MKIAPVILNRRRHLSLVPRTGIGLPTRVLVVDDSEDCRLILRITLKRLRIEADFAASGPAAISAVEKNAYDLVLMDVSMPGMSGFETTETLRLKRFSQPIIAVTAYMTPNLHEECCNAGMSAVVTKPFNITELVAAICDPRVHFTTV